MKSRVVRAEGMISAVKLSTLVALLGMALLLVSCSSTTEPTRVITIVPMSQTVAIQPAVHGPTLSVDVKLTNTSPNPIYYSSCGVSLQRKADGPIALNSGGIWLTVWSQICTAEATFPPPTLQPGESVTIPITAVVSTNSQFPPNFDGAPGLYRVQFLLATKVLTFSHQLSREESSSDPFTVNVLESDGQ